MKRIISLFVLTGFVLMVFAQNIAMGIDNMTMRDITAYDLVAEMNVGINIGNSLDSVGTDETSWGNPAITKELIYAYKKAGFNTIRLPVTWATHMESDGSPNTTWLNRVEEVVNWILDEDLYCIINTHHEGGWLHTSDGMTERKTKFKTLWTVISNRFKNYGDHLLFEGFNEIQKKEGDWSAASEEDYANTNILSQVFVDAVRATGGNNRYRTLIISTYGAIHTTYGFELPEDTVENRLAVEFHCYYPQQFCFEWGTQSTWGSKNDLLEVEAYCREFSEFTNNRIPVLLGEFGAVDKNNSDARAAYSKTVATYCKQYGIKPIWWDNGNTGTDKFGIVDRTTYQVTMPGIVSALVDNSQYVTASTTIKPTSSASTTTTTKLTPSTTPNVSTKPTSSSITTTTIKPTPSATTTTTTRLTPSTTPNVSTKPTSSSITTTTIKPTSSATTVISKPYIGGATGLKTEFISVNTVKISWDNAANADGYIVYKNEKGRAQEYYKTLIGNEFFDVLYRGKTYEYHILAFAKTNGCIFYSENTKTVKLSVLARKISTISKMTTKKTALFTINSVVGAEKYEIKYSTRKSLKGAKTKISSSNKFSLKGLKKNTKYYARIRAFKKINGKKVYTSSKKIDFITKK